MYVRGGNIIGGGGGKILRAAPALAKTKPKKWRVNRTGMSGERGRGLERRVVGDWRKGRHDSIVRVGPRSHEILPVIPNPPHANSGVQSSTDNRTGYVVDLAGNIYERFYTLASPFSARDCPFLGVISRVRRPSFHSNCRLLSPAMIYQLTIIYNYFTHFPKGKEIPIGG